MDSVTIGLDIGSSAARAAEIYVQQGKRVLRRYAQVGLAPGWVVDGEIINVPEVSAALRRLWAEGHFSSHKVVVGVSGPRVFVRQAEMQGLRPDEIRSALKFEGQEFVPIPMDEACLDLSILPPATTESDEETVPILIVAAHRELVLNHLAALKGAGLTPVAVDASPLALVRAVPTLRRDESSKSGMEVLVSIGADLTTIAVREDGVPKFIRSLTTGGARLTESLANTMHLELAIAERLKRSRVSETGTSSAAARKAIAGEIRDLAEEVRATTDFFMGHAESPAIDRMLVTGGASEMDGLTAALVNHLPIEVFRINPFAPLTIGDTGLTPDELERAEATATTAIGLALWSAEQPLIRLSLLPEEIEAARRSRRVTMLCGAGVAGVAVLLGALGVGQILSTRSAQHQAHAVEVQANVLSARQSKLEAATAAHSQVAARAGVVVQALTGDIDWVRLLGQLSAVMPANLHLTSFSGAATSSSSSAATSASSSTKAGSGIGTLTFSVQGSGGLPAAAAWLNGLQKDRSIQGVWVSGISLSGNGGQVTFNSTGSMTMTAQSDRAKQVQK